MDKRRWSSVIWIALALLLEPVHAALFIVNGSITSIDADSIRVKAGNQTEYQCNITSTTQLWFNKKNAVLDDFKQGSRVVLRFKSKSKANEALELSDADTAAWLVTVRRKTCKAKILEVAPKGIKVLVEGGVFFYSVADNTAITLDNKPAKLDSLKPDMTVFTTPKYKTEMNTIAIRITDKETDSEKK